MICVNNPTPYSNITKRHAHTPHERTLPTRHAPCSARAGRLSQRPAPQVRKQLHHITQHFTTLQQLRCTRPRHNKKTKLAFKIGLTSNAMWPGHVFSRAREHVPSLKAGVCLALAGSVGGIRTAPRVDASRVDDAAYPVRRGRSVALSPPANASATSAPSLPPGVVQEYRTRAAFDVVRKNGDVLIATACRCMLGM